ncbi:MAG: sigma-70 family RNA polymerase sigma factor [Candidatus Hydrogenedentota bacterium]|nr:MAG: sigma-70 family RNA polymerase sigma factor [Candidatus Hydrogenedentota bacterium]
MTITGSLWWQETSLKEKARGDVPPAILGEPPRIAELTLKTGKKVAKLTLEREQEDVNHDWEQFYLKEREMLFRYLIQYTEEETAMELLQESFAQLLRMAMKKEIHHPRGYLYKIARSLLFQKNARSMPIIENSPLVLDNLISHYDNAETSLEKKELNILIQQSLQELSEIEKEVFLLRIESNLSTKEISQTLHKSERHIRRILERCRKKLKAFFIQKGFRL